MSSAMGATFRFRVFVGLTSALLCHPRFPTADSSSQDNGQHRSHCWSLSVQAEIGNVVFEIDWNEFVLSMPIHQFSQNEFSFPDQLRCESESCIHDHVRGRNLVFLCTRSLQHCTTLLCTPVSLPFRDLTTLLCTPVSLPFRDLSNPFSSYP